MVQNIFSILQPPPFVSRRAGSLKIEEEARLVFEDHYFLLNKSLHSRKLHLEDTPRVLQKLNDLWGKSGSEKVLEWLYHLTICYHLYRFDYPAIISFGEQLKANSQTSLQPLHAVNSHFMAYACLKLKDYKRGFQLAQPGSPRYPANPLGEVSFSETAFILALREKRYQEAESTAAEALQKAGGRESSLGALRWKILRGYLRFVAAPQVCDCQLDFKAMRAAVGQLAGGPSLAVLLGILEFSCLLAVHNTVDATILFSEIDGSFKKYRTINHVEARRLEWWRGFLFTLIKNEFDIEKMNPSAIKILEKLKTDVDPYSPSEIIPFSELGRGYLQRLVAAH